MSVATRHQLGQADENLGRDAEKRCPTFEWVGCVVIMSPCATFVHVGNGSSYNLVQVVEVVFHQSGHCSTALSNPNVFW
jgi:hypothetical protein